MARGGRVGRHYRPRRASLPSESVARGVDGPSRVPAGETGTGRRWGNAHTWSFAGTVPYLGAMSFVRSKPHRALRTLRAPDQPRHGRNPKREYNKHYGLKLPVFHECSSKLSGALTHESRVHFFNLFSFRLPLPHPSASTATKVRTVGAFPVKNVPLFCPRRV